MKIIFTGGGTGGHFYPIIGIIEAMRDVAKEKKLLDPTLYFLAPDPYNERLLFDNLVTFKKVPAGKMRIYFSPLNIIDWFKTAYGILVALWKVFWIYPDVIFSKGGYGAFPIVVAGRILGIPIIIHESDSAPGKVNAWSGKFAEKIAISYPEAAEYFPKDKVAWTGNPIRKEIMIVANQGAKEYLDLEPGIPTLLILGGSQGAQIINDEIVNALPELVKKYQIIHQAGATNIEEVKNTANLLLDRSQYAYRYRPYAYLDDLAMRMSAGACDMVISRAGSTIFEIANWSKPSIVIPIAESNRDHQRKNAYTYARTGAATVIEESNLSDDVLLAEIDRVLSDKSVNEEMIKGAKEFAKPEAAKTIAAEILEIGLTHE